MKLWKVFCMEDEFPGLWRQWYKNQCVAVGWSPWLGHKLKGKTKNRGWQVARKRLLEISEGDHVVVQLKHHRIGRIGEVVGKAIEDHEWNPLVPPSKNLPKGQMGRRILVRWDLTAGPDDKDDVVQLSQDMRFGRSEYRTTICVVKSIRLNALRKAMSDPNNWVGLGRQFAYERSLSDYIAAYPHRLEDGSMPYPSKKVREKVFKDKTRGDVLLLDRDNQPVIVECKQEALTLKHVKQLQHYTQLLKKETGKPVRGFLVHGSARQIHPKVSRIVKRIRNIDIVQYQLGVEFTPCLY